MHTITSEQHTVLLKGLETLTRLYWGPSLADCQHMIQDSYFHSIDKLLIFCSIDAQDVLDRLRDTVRPFTNAGTLKRHLEECYVRLFINSQDGITAPLYASCYTGLDQGLMGKPAIKMRALFESKGLNLDEGIGEPPDHLAIELEYLYFLLNQNSDDAPLLIAQEAVAFTSDMVLPWVNQFYDQLVNETLCLFYPRATQLLVSLLNYISAPIQSRKS